MNLAKESSWCDTFFEVFFNNLCNASYRPNLDLFRAACYEPEEFVNEVKWNKEKRRWFLTSNKAKYVCVYERVWMCIVSLHVDFDAVRTTGARRQWECFAEI